MEVQPQSRPIAMARDELQPASSQRKPPVALSESQGMLRDSDRQPGSSKQRPPSQPETQPLSSKRLPPIIVQESMEDDGDSTFVFSRADMGFVAPAEAAEPAPAPQAAAEKQPVYLPFTDEDEQTLIERPAFLNDPNDTITAVRPPGRKD
jgi:hypothetical protein